MNAIHSRSYTGKPMNVPDWAVGSSIPVLAGSLAWGARQFVLSVVTKRGPQGTQGEPGPAGPEMTVRAFNQLADLLTQRLNGRYMLAIEARERFDRIETLIDRMTEK